MSVSKSPYDFDAVHRQHKLEALKNRQSIQTIKRNHDECQPLKISGMDIVKRPALLPKDMGVKPDVVSNMAGFIPPNYGPPRGAFWKDQALQKCFMSALTDPDDFYVQNTQAAEALSTLETSMTDWYNNYKKHRTGMRKHDVQIGGFYAVYYKEAENWRRACVKDIIVNNVQTEYHVQLLDYGIHALIKLTEIYPLRLEYLDLPIQACSAYLYDSTKPRQVWTDLDNKKFKKDFNEKTVTLYVVSSKENLLEVFPCISVIIVPEGNAKEECYTLGGKIKISMHKTETEVEGIPGRKYVIQKH